MNEFYLYFLKSGLSLIVLYALYYFVFRKETYFSLNRIFLIASLLLSFLLPFIKVTYTISNPQQTYYYLLDTLVINSGSIDTTSVFDLSALQIVLIIYLTGVIAFAARFVFRILQIINLIGKNDIQRINGQKVVVLKENLSPFSFFNLIFIRSEDINRNDSQKIIAHEKIHIRQFHSFDILVIEALIIIQWFNPFLWLYRNSLKELHEYLADQGMIRNNNNGLNYKMLLLNQTFGVSLNDITNNFNQSLLKRRFIMMSKSKTKRSAGIKLLLILPLAILLFLSFTMNTAVLSQDSNEDLPASPVVEENVRVPQPETVAEVPSVIKPPVQPQKQQEEDIYTVVKYMPEFPGGREKLFEYLANNIKYPEEAVKNKIEGTVFITFVIEKDGSVTNIELLRGIDKACDEEAVRVVKNMPKWKAGKLEDGSKCRVQFNLPIKFNLESDKKEK